MSEQLGLDFRAPVRPGPPHRTSGATPAGFARNAAATDEADAVLRLAEGYAARMLEELGHMTVWRVRVWMGRDGVLENEGKERLDCLGALGRRMGLVARGRERPHGPDAKELPVTHLNYNTIWVRRTA